MTTSTYTVVGMTCGHCVNSVTEEVSQVPGVTDVNVDLASGGLTVTSDTAVDDSAVQAAVEEAGYQVTAPASLTVVPVGQSASRPAAAAAAAEDPAGPSLVVRILL